MSRKKKMPIRNATAAQLKRLGLKKKFAMFPLDLALDLEAQAEREGRTEGIILVDAYRAYKKEFEAFLERVAAAKEERER